MEESGPQMPGGHRTETGRKVLHHQPLRKDLVRTLYLHQLRHEPEKKRIFEENITAESLIQRLILEFGSDSISEGNTLTLSNEREEFEISGLPAVDVVKVKNPITEDHACLRAYLMPSLIRILRHNKNRDLPQKIFEVGYVIRDTLTVPHLCALQAASRTSFTEIKSLTESVLREIRIEYTIEPCDYPTFLPGRGAIVRSEGKVLGIFGEMSPKCITDYGLTHPIMMMEMNLSDIIASRSGRLF